MYVCVSSNYVAVFYAQCTLVARSYHMEFSFISTADAIFSLVVSLTCATTELELFKVIPFYIQILKKVLT